MFFAVFFVALFAVVAYLRSDEERQFKRRFVANLAVVVMVGIAMALAISALS